MYNTVWLFFKKIRWILLVSSIIICVITLLNHFHTHWQEINSYPFIIVYSVSFLVCTCCLLNLGNTGFWQLFSVSRITKKYHENTQDIDTVLYIGICFSLLFLILFLKIIGVNIQDLTIYSIGCLAIGSAYRLFCD